MKFLKNTIIKHLFLILKTIPFFLFSISINAQIEMKTSTDVEVFQQSIPIDQNYFRSSEQIDNLLIKSWKLEYPEIYELYLSLNDEDKKFVTVFRGINKSGTKSKINLNQRGRSYQFGPNVFTSPSPLISLIYAQRGTMYKFRIPIGFFPDQRNQIQFLISTRSAAANLNAFVIEQAEHDQRIVIHRRFEDRLNAFNFKSTLQRQCRDIFRY